MVCKNGIGTDYILSVRTFPLKMPVYILILQCFEQPIGAFRTSVSFLVAQLPVPFVPAYRLVAGFPGGPAVPSPRKHVLTPLEQIAEHIHFFFQRQITFHDRRCRHAVPVAQQSLQLVHFLMKKPILCKKSVVFIQQFLIYKPFFHIVQNCGNIYKGMHTVFPLSSQSHTFQFKIHIFTLLYIANIHFFLIRSQKNGHPTAVGHPPLI